MSDEARRVFKMRTVLDLAAGKSGDNVSELVGYLAQRDLNSQEEMLAAPLAKAWLYKEMPALLDARYDDTLPYEEWAKKQTSRLGENISTTPIPESERAGLNMVLDAMAQGKVAVSEQTAKADDLEAQVAELSPYKAKVAALDKEIAKLKAQVQTLEGQVKDLKAKAAGFEGKVPVDENDLASTVKEIVSKAVKVAVAAMPKAAPGAAAAAGAEAAAEAPAEEAASSVPDDFGFGASGAGDGGFGF